MEAMQTSPALSSQSNSMTAPAFFHAMPETLADLQERLGFVPLERIRFRPYPGTARETDVLAALEGPRKRRCELIEGVLVEKPMGYRESSLALFLAVALDGFVRPRNLGLISGEAGAVQLFGGLIRIPDVAFTSWDRLPGRRVPDAPIPALVPDLAVEILSRSNTLAEMARKRQEYFTAGVRLVWEIDPDARTVSIYTGADTVRVLGAGDTLDGGAVLPGFTLPLPELFAELDRQG
jgi:Uma2 family endonuclease